MSDLYENCYKELSSKLIKNELKADNKKKRETLIRFVEDHVTTVMRVYESLNTENFIYDIQKSARDFQTANKIPERWTKEQVHGFMKEKYFNPINALTVNDLR